MGADVGGSSRWEGCFQFCKRSRRWLMASSCSSIAAVGISFRVLESKGRAWMRRYALVEVGCARWSWRKSMVSEIRVDLVAVSTTLFCYEELT